MNRIVFLCILFAFVMALPVGGAAAQGGGPSDDEVNAIAKNLYCPVCENVPLDVCPTAACQQWRQQIANQLAAGWSEEEIYAYFVEQYGDRVLAAPPARGLNWLVYVLPPLALALGAVLVARVLRGAREPEMVRTPRANSGRPDYARQIEDELEARR